MMSAFVSSTSSPDEKSELLSAKAMRLADRIAGLVERTLNLYEAHLVLAEANPPRADTPAEEPPTAPRAPRVRKDSSRPRVPNGGIAQLAQLKSLVRSMEALLRIARLARELEKADAERVDKSWMDPDALRRFLSEVDDDYEEASWNSKQATTPRPPETSSPNPMITSPYGPALPPPDRRPP